MVNWTSLLMPPVPETAHLDSGANPVGPPPSFPHPVEVGMEQLIGNLGVHVALHTTCSHLPECARILPGWRRIPIA